MESSEEAACDIEISRLESEIGQLRRKLFELRSSRPPEKVQDYTFYGPGGLETRLSEMFGQHKDLILIHNMGRKCAYCTLWADGFNGIVAHLENRSAFVMVSPDDPGSQHEFAVGRGWKFKYFSAKGSTFIRDMGYETDNGKFIPGVSTFYKDDSDGIVRVSTAEFGPGDEFCSAWHFFMMLRDGAASWQPKFSY